MSAQIIRGNALHLPLAAESADLICTSPPYFGLRSYQDAGEHYAGQLGTEATPGEFVDALIGATREMIRVLKPSGSIWINLGDKYDGNKSLMLIPHRYAIRCVDDLGLILRAEIIWNKPNGLPESVQDRVRRSHEQWFHFTKEPRYYSAVDEIREEHAGEFLSSGVRNPRHRYADGKMPSHSAGILGPSSPQRGDGGTLVGEARHPLGKLPGSVWTIPTQPLKVPAHLGIDHFAAFPMELPRRIITAWSPRDVCTVCGEGRRPISKGGGYDPEVLARRGAAAHAHSKLPGHGKPSPMLLVNLSGPEKDRYRIPHTIIGYACVCPDTTAPTTPGIVVDPFGGTGTTALVASVLGRHGITVDMSSDYCRLAEWRCNDPGERARAMQVDKPAAQVDGQEALFEVSG